MTLLRSSPISINIKLFGALLLNSVSFIQYKLTEHLSFSRVMEGDQWIFVKEVLI